MYLTTLKAQSIKSYVTMTKKHSARDGFGVWRFLDGRMDFGKYQMIEGHLVERQPEEINACVEDGMTTDEWLEHTYEKDAQKQRDKYGKADRDEEERRLNEHIDSRKED